LPLFAGGEWIIIVSNDPELIIVTDNIQKLIEALYGIEGNIQLSQVWCTHKALKLDK
jgi:hypothetical protein